MEDLVRCGAHCVVVRILNHVINYVPGRKEMFNNLLNFRIKLKYNFMLFIMISLVKDSLFFSFSDLS